MAAVAQKVPKESAAEPESIQPKIYARLLKFQKLHISLSKDGDNPHFKSKYVTLNEVMKKVKKPLNDLGCLILQIPSNEGLTTQIMCVDDGSLVECFMPYSDISTAQKLGSSITYNRRYSIRTLLGLDDDDDDGNEASSQGKEDNEDEDDELSEDDYFRI